MTSSSTFDAIKLMIHPNTGRWKPEELKTGEKMQLTRLHHQVLRRWLDVGRHRQELDLLPQSIVSTEIL